MLRLVHAVLAASADGRTSPPTATDNLLTIVTKPDNIPIILLGILVGFYTYLSFREARAHDRLIRDGRKDEVLKTMQE